MNNKEIILHLSLLNGIGSGVIQNIIQSIGKDRLFQLYEWNAQEVRQQCGISEKQANSIVTGLSNVTILHKELGYIEEYKAQWMTVTCDEYPSLLQDIDVPPAVLYFYGSNICSDQKMLAVVGARKSHSYAKDAIIQLTRPLLQDGWTIISGGALGADTYAHRLATEESGKTIVVQGAGLGFLYPTQNQTLFEKIVYNGGMIISSFAMKQDSRPEYFPMRNRIIAGLSQGCLVVQAAKRSGALITAEFALQQGREVFAVPGPLYDPLSVGCHLLIQQGAQLVQSSSDIEQGIYGELKHVQGAIKQKKEEHQQQLFGDEHDQAILQHTVVAISTEDLQRKSSIDSTVLHQKLFSLSLDGKVEQDCMGLWKRI